MKQLCLPFLFIVAALTTDLHGELAVYSSGNDADVRPRLHGPVLILSGGGGNHEPGLQRAIDVIRGCSDCDVLIDAVVIRASGDDSYNPLLMSLQGVNSVLTMVITDRESAMRPDLAESVRRAELIFFGGGDQCNYLRWVRGTAVGEAVKHVFRRGGAIGGSSAGLAIQGEIVYDACPDQSARSATVLADPFHVDVSLSRGFFSWPLMAHTITDTHFQQRDRLGRLLVFMSRALAERKERRVLGIGVSEGTTLVVDRRGKSTVTGEGPVHIILAKSRAQTLQPGTPLTHRGFRIMRLEQGATVDLRRLPRKGWKRIDVIEGEVTANPY